MYRATDTNRNAASRSKVLPAAMPSDAWLSWMGVLVQLVVA